MWNQNRLEGQRLSVKVGYTVSLTTSLSGQTTDGDHIQVNLLQLEDLEVVTRCIDDENARSTKKENRKS